MRGPASVLRALLPTKYKLKPINNTAGSSGNLAISTLKKRGNGGDSTEGRSITKEKTETAVAFSRPPPLPPVLGPLVALTLIETWLNRDRDDN